MNYAQIRQFDIANGPGIRTTLFVSGCTHNCKGCFNKAYQDFNYGTPWNEEAERIFMGMVNDPKVSGVTVLGGEPMDQSGDAFGYNLVNLLRKVKQETKKNIWLYSGYTFEQILDDPFKLTLLQQCDVLVDGEFIEELKDVRLRFKGSSNQRIINVQKSLELGHVVLMESY